VESPRIPLAKVRNAMLRSFEAAFAGLRASHSDGLEIESLPLVD